VTASDWCDACGSASAEPLFETADRRFGLPGRFTLLRCAGCGLVRTDPVPERPGDYYPTAAYYSYQPPPPPSPRARRRVAACYQGDRLARWSALRLDPGLPPGPPGAVLDVGCGSGAFLRLLETAGWDVHGVELDESAVEAAHAAGLTQVQAGTLADSDHEPASFDAVRFWHCLEHVPSPRSELLRARRLLRPGGALVIGVPNFGSLLSRLARDRWFYLDVPRHLWHFERASLATLLRATGFELERMRIVSTGTPLLGTIDFVRGRGERLLGSRAAFFASLPAAVALDAVRAGDALQVVARPSAAWREETDAPVGAQVEAAG
jgi:2-polyprenyl-3-methyl-5-hydroxy-6-metoxy-1,4-benzoquinol methylase